MAHTAGSLYRRALKDHWFAYTAGITTVLVTSATEVLIPKFVQWCVDTVSGKGQAPDLFSRGTRVATLGVIITWMLGLLLIGLVGRVGWRQILARRTHMAGRELKVRFWDVLRFLPLRTFHDYPLGDLMNRATGDWNASRAIHGFTLVMTLDLIFFTVLSLGCMLSISPELTLYCLAVFPLLPRIILKLAKKEHDLHLVAQERLSDLSDSVSQALGTIRLQRATNSDALWQTRLKAEARDYAEKRFQVVKTGWKIFPLGAIPTLLAYAVLLIWGVRKIGTGELTVGQFVAMQSYVLMLQGPLFDMGDVIAEWQRGFASLSRMAEIFNLQKTAERQTAKSLEPALGSGPVIEVRRLTFAYEVDTRPVLKDLDLVIKARETIGIYGPIGAGKTTLLSLLAGLVEAPKGTCHLGGGDVTDVARAWLSRHVAMVPQRSFLFAGTIRYNLELDEAFGEAELWRVLHAVHLEQDVRGFKDGLDSRVGEWGINLSGGQKQRLALARALLRPREVLFLDDCLSAVDAVTEEEILHRLAGRLAGATVVWVAHRMSTLKLCNKVYRLDAGRLTAVPPGSRPVLGHKTLVSQGALP